MPPAHRIAAVALAAALAFAAFPALADDLIDGIKTLPGAVEDVRIAGTWDQGSKSGAYRVLLTRTGGDSVTARMFVQWIVYQDDGSAAVQDTIEIKELAALKVDVVDYTSDSDDNGLAIYIQTLDPNSANDQDYELHITSPTQYTFGPQSN